MKATKNQHEQLDREWKEVLEAFPEYAWMARRDILLMWGEEKRYLSMYGKRYPQITNLQPGLVLEPIDRKEK